MEGGRAGHLTVRVALYYAPSPADPLWDAACAWLGWDAERGAAVPQPPLPGIIELTAEPRVYGFHATLKPPMRLATDYGSLLDDVTRLARTTAPFHLPALAVADLSGFLALRETEACEPLHRLADACVRALDGHRAPPSEVEMARHRGSGLDEAHEANLIRWGYPHVLAQWRFHMTLTRRMTAGEQQVVRPAAEAHLAAALGRLRAVTAIAVFTQPAPGTPFRIAERVPLTG